MPYEWSQTPSDTTTAEKTLHEMHLWPHNALPPYGFAAMILGFFLFASIPLFGLLGTMLLWGVLPFMLVATAALYYALRRNSRDRQILEVLTVTPKDTRLVRTEPTGAQQDWRSNTYWVRVALYQQGGPVPNYVTLAGNGREVEIGAFLSEDERKALFSELSDLFRAAARPDPDPSV